MRLLKRMIFWLLQALVVSAAAWLLLRANYLDALEDLVPSRIPSAHYVTLLLLQMTVVTGGIAAIASMIFAMRVETQPLLAACGVILCTCILLWVYIWVAINDGDYYELTRYFLSTERYQVFGVIVVLGVAILNGMLSMLAGALNRPPHQPPV
jgi:hypothetical protein